MNVNVEEISTVRMKMSVTIPKEEVNDEREKRLQTVLKEAQLKGFRAGKVPRSIVEKRFGKRINEETVSEILDESIKKSLEQEQLQPISEFEIEDIQREIGQDLSYTVTFEVLPQFELQELTGLEVVKQVAEISDEDVDKGIERLQRQFGELQELERKAQLGDSVLIDFVGEIDGKPFPGGSGESMLVELGEKKFIPGFEEGLIGVEINQELDVKATFPKDYKETTLAGKDAVFKVKVKKISGMEKAKLDSRFARKIGIKDGNADEIRNKVKANMDSYLAGTITAKARETVMEVLLQGYSFEVPETLVSDEVKRIPAAPDADADQEAKRKEEACKRIKLRLLVEKIAKAHNITPSESEIREKLHEVSAMLADMGINPENMPAPSSQEFLHGIFQSALFDAVADFLLEKAMIKEERSTFKEIAGDSASDSSS